MLESDCRVICIKSRSLIVSEKIRVSCSFVRSTWKDSRNGWSVSSVNG